MKTAISIHIMAAFLYGGGLIWTIIEALNYFIKDAPFNIWSLVLLISGISIMLLNLAIGVIKIYNGK